MFKREVTGDEIEFALGEKAEAEITSLDRDFLEWVADDPRTTRIVARLCGSRPGFPDMEAMLLVSLMRNEYISRRKYDAEQSERDDIAEQLMEEPDTYEAPV